MGLAPQISSVLAGVCAEWLRGCAAVSDPSVTLSSLPYSELGCHYLHLDKGICSSDPMLEGCRMYKPLANQVSRLENRVKLSRPREESTSKTSRQTLFYLLPCSSEWMLEKGKWIPTWGRESPWGDLPFPESLLPFQRHITTAPWGQGQTSLSDLTPEGREAHWPLLLTSMHREGSLQGAVGGIPLGFMPSRKGYSGGCHRWKSCNTLAKNLETFVQCGITKLFSVHFLLSSHWTQDSDLDCTFFLGGLEQVTDYNLLHVSL